MSHNIHCRTYKKPRGQVSKVQYNIRYSTLANGSNLLFDNTVLMVCNSEWDLDLLEDALSFGVITEKELYDLTQSTK